MRKIAIQKQETRPTRATAKQKKGPTQRRRKPWQDDHIEVTPQTQRETTVAQPAEPLSAALQMRVAAAFDPQGYGAEPLQQMAFDLDEEEPLQQMAFDLDELEEEPTQMKAEPGNRTGLTDRLKGGIEQMTRMSMDDVKVHYNSPRPAQIQAHAYTQGTEIHVAPGQEQHLPHEAWHVVQQKQGRVRPTTSVNGMAVNDHTGLEREADIMGAKAAQMPMQAQEKETST